MKRHWYDIGRVFIYFVHVCFPCPCLSCRTVLLLALPGTQISLESSNTGGASMNIAAAACLDTQLSITVPRVRALVVTQTHMSLGTEAISGLAAAAAINSQR